MYLKANLFNVVSNVSVIRFYKVLDLFRSSLFCCLKTLALYLCSSHKFPDLGKADLVGLNVSKAAILPVAPIMPS